MKSVGRNNLGSAMSARRWAYIRANGPIPDSAKVYLLCKTRTCVNPKHLELLTHAQHTQRGTVAKLTLAQAREIRAAKLLAPRGTGIKLAAKYGVSPATISDIWVGKTWNNV
jgi:hypothetical protein